MSILIDLGEARIEGLQKILNHWQPTSRSVNVLEEALTELIDLIYEMDQIPGENRNRKLEDFVDVNQFECAERFKAWAARLNLEENAGILACDHYGDCLTLPNYQVAHITDIEEALQAAQEAV